MTEQPALFADEEITPWKAEWQDMPEYSHEHLLAKFQVVVNFACESDLAEFCRVLEQSIPPTAARQMKSIWFPATEIGRFTNKRYAQAR